LQNKLPFSSKNGLAPGIKEDLRATGSHLTKTLTEKWLQPITG